MTTESAIPAEADVAELLRTILEPDGFRADVRAWPSEAEQRIVIELIAVDAECADCLVPKHMLAAVLARKLDLPADVVVELVYPNDR